MDHQDYKENTETYVRDDATNQPVVQGVDSFKESEAEDGSGDHVHQDGYQNGFGNGFGDSRENGTSSSLSNESDTIVRDDFDSGLNAAKRSSLSVNAPVFVPSGFSSSNQNDITQGLTPSIQASAADPVKFTESLMSDLTSPHLQTKVSDRISRIRMSGAGEAVRDLLQKELSSINPVSVGVDGVGINIQEQNAPLASAADIHYSGGDNVTASSLDEKLRTISPENEGITVSDETATTVRDTEEDCPVPYVVPRPEPNQQMASDTSFLRDTDETTATHVVDELLAGINDHIDHEPEWMDVMGTGILMKRTLHKGQTDIKPQRFSEATIRCSAVVLDNGFDNSGAALKVVDKQDSLKFTVGDLEVIQGLDLAVQLMEKGEIAEFRIAPKLAYGESGHQELGIPSDATLLYTVELLNVEIPIEIETIPISERISIANHKVDRGNFWYKRNEPMIALSLYQRAVSILERPNDQFMGPEDSEKLNAAKGRAYGNLSSAQVEKQVWDEGLLSVSNALRYSPNDGKLLCRKVKIQREKGQYEEALETCEEALRKEAVIGESYAKKLKDDIVFLKKQKSQSDSKEREMAKRMFGAQPPPKSAESATTVVKETVTTTTTRSDNSAQSRPASSPSGSGSKWLYYGAAAAVAAAGIYFGVKYYRQHS